MASTGLSAIPSESDEFSAVLHAARQGSSAALGRLFVSARPYLVGIAEAELEPLLRARGSGSDLAQEALIEAQAILARFQGSRFEEFLAWLRAILLNKLADFRRHYFGAGMRRVDRERSLPEGSGEQAGANLAGTGSTPSAVLEKQEEEQRLRRALERLPTHYQQVIQWRNFEGLPFAEIGLRLNRTEDAARMLWARAIEQLRDELERGA